MFQKVLIISILLLLGACSHLDTIDANKEVTSQNRTPSNAKPVTANLNCVCSSYKLINRDSFEIRATNRRQSSVYAASHIKDWGNMDINTLVAFVKGRPKGPIFSSTSTTDKSDAEYAKNESQECIEENKPFSDYFNCKVIVTTD